MHKKLYNIMPTDLMLNTDNGDYYTIVSALGVNSKREEKQKGTLIFDRSASLPFVSNDEPAQNGDISENVGTDAQSATEKNNAPMDTLSVSSENITQTTQNDKQESVAAKNNFKTKETTSPKTGAVTFESAIKTNLPSKVFSEVKKIAQKYGGTLSEAKDKTFRFKDEESRAKFEEESSSYIQNAKAQTGKENPKVENVKPAENKTSSESVADAKEEKVSESEKPKERTTIFGSDEETTRDLLEAFGLVESAKRNTVKSTKENTIPADKFVNVIDDSDEALARYFDELEKALKKTSANPMFNPEVWTASLKIGLVYVQRGINNFADWAKKITETATNKKSKEIADELENWQPAIWEMLQTMPKIDKFSDKQITSIANRIGHLYETGTTDFEDIRKDFIANIGEENTNKHYSLIKATYNGIERFFADLQENSAETAKDKTEHYTDKNKSQQQVTEVQFESEELDKIFEDLETYYGNTKDIEKLSKRLKKMTKELPIEMTEDLIKSTQKEAGVSENEAKEIIADSILNRLENNVSDYVEASERFNYFDENYNQPDSAADSSERRTVEKIAKALYSIKKLFQSKMEDTIDNLDAALAQIKNPSKKITERHKKIMRVFQTFEGLVTEETEQEAAEKEKANEAPLTESKKLFSQRKNGRLKL